MRDKFFAHGKIELVAAPLKGKRWKFCGLRTNQTLPHASKCFGLLFVFRLAEPVPAGLVFFYNNLKFRLFKVAIICSVINKITPQRAEVPINRIFGEAAAGQRQFQFLHVGLFEVTLRILILGAAQRRTTQ